MDSREQQKHALTSLAGIIINLQLIFPYYVHLVQVYLPLEVAQSKFLPLKLPHKLRELSCSLYSSHLIF